jgi:DNA-binding GntR family transcriptional regulator
MAMTYSIKKSLSYHEQVYKSLKEMIFKEVFQPGERIYETKIAREFEISRSPVREAIRALEQEGLLVTDEKSRVTVYEPTLKDVEDIYECRKALESLAASLAARHARDEDIKKLSENLKQSREVIRNLKDNQKGSKEMLHLNTEFHQIIRRSTNNKRLQKQINDLQSLTYFYRKLNMEGEQRCQRIVKEHEEIFELIKNRDEEKTLLLMKEHINNDLQHLKIVITNHQ